MIPETAEIEGTIRAVSERPGRRCTTASAGWPTASPPPTAAEREVEIIAGYPVTTNDDSFAQFAIGVADRRGRRRHVVRLPHPVMGAEDFSYLLQNVPGAMMFLGGTPPDRNPATAAPNHSNRVYFDEAAMTAGISLYATAALQHLRPSELIDAARCARCA